MAKKKTEVGQKKELPIIEVQRALKDWFDMRRNEITGTIEVRNKDEHVFKEIKEDNLFIKLLNNGYRISQGVLSALFNSDFVQTYNPFKVYFESLPEWNEQCRDYINEVANHVKAFDQQQFNIQFKKMLVRAVACAIDDRSINKHAFILLGKKQHTGKSTFCKYLIPKSLKDYYTENITSDKDGMVCLSENFIINLDELSGMKKFDLNNLKSMFSKDTVKVRQAFARKPQTAPRRASFIGSTNEDDFLTDRTGSVRWLCFEIEYIDFDYVKIDVDLLWSQAYALYKSGFDFHLTADEVKENENRNKKFQQNSEEYDYVQKYFLPATESDFHSFRTATEIRDYIITMSERKAEIRSVEKLGKVLTQLGYQKVSKRSTDRDNPVYGYYVQEL